jgi:hypothetical protein
MRGKGIKGRVFQVRQGKRADCPLQADSLHHWDAEDTENEGRRTGGCAAGGDGRSDGRVAVGAAVGGERQADCVRTDFTNGPSLRNSE